MKNEKRSGKTVNKGAALWSRPKTEITEEEYKQFYANISYDSEAPLVTLHNRVEGNLEYISLLFIPSKAPFDLWDREQRARYQSLRASNLYSR